MPLYKDEDGIDISVRDAVNNCETTLHVKSHKTLSQKLSHWCQGCECGFKTGTTSSNSVCPICGCALDEFDWEEISYNPADDVDWMFPNGYDEG